MAAQFFCDIVFQRQYMVLQAPPTSLCLHYLLIRLCEANGKVVRYIQKVFAKQSFRITSCRSNTIAKELRGWLDIKMPPYQYMESDYGDKTILRPSYIHNGISHTGKMAFYIESGSSDLRGTPMTTTGINWFARWQHQNESWIISEPLLLIAAVSIPGNNFWSRLRGYDPNPVEVIRSPEKIMTQSNNNGAHATNWAVVSCTELRPNRMIRFKIRININFQLRAQRPYVLSH